MDTFAIQKSAKSQKNHHRSSRFFAGLRTIVVSVVVMLLGLGRQAQAKETVIVNELKTHNDKILIKMLQQTNSLVEYHRRIAGEEMICSSILKNQLTKNYPLSIENIAANIDYSKWAKMAVDQIPPTIRAQDIPLIKRVDSILDLLKGHCLHYKTSTFIYEYCHKQHVRQYDDPITKFNNQKKEFQDIYMGYYNPPAVDARKARLGIKTKTAAEKQSIQPTPADFSEEYNHMRVEHLDKKMGFAEFQEDNSGNIIQSSIHLAAFDSYITYEPVIVSIYCKNNEEQPQVTNYALLVTPYDFVYTKKVQPCHKLNTFNVVKHGVSYFKDSHAFPLRAFGKYLYGNVEERCTSNWVWQRNEQNQEIDVNLAEGATLFLQFFNQQTQSYESQTVVVARILNSYLIELKHPFGVSINKKHRVFYIDDSIAGWERKIANITRCELLFQKDIDYDNLLDNSVKYLRGNLLKFSYPIENIREQQPLGCICESFKGSKGRIIDLSVKLGKEIFPNTYESFITTNTLVIQWKWFKQDMLMKCRNMLCFSFKEEEPKQIKNKTKFTQMVRLTAAEAIMQVTEDNLEHIYILMINKAGMIKLRTTDSSGNVYTYLLTQGQIIRIRQFANGTKQIVKQNKYYENSTSPTSQLSQNYIYIKCSKLTNGSYHGGIWKTGDNVFFPRFTLKGQIIQSFQRVHGHADFRILHPQKMSNPSSLAIVSYIEKIEDAYRITPQQVESHDDKQKKLQSVVFLQDSYSINYTFVSGEYCNPPINKFRQTIVTLKCGEAWFQITKLLQISVCQYWIEVETSLLCGQNTRKVVETDQKIPNKAEEDNVIFSGVLCRSAIGLLDEAYPYLFIGDYLRDLLKQQLNEQLSDQLQFDLELQEGVLEVQLAIKGD